MNAYVNRYFGNHVNNIHRKHFYSSLAVNVKVFGAYGNGIADDSIACQKALDHVRNLGGGVVFFPAGIYRIGLNSHNGQMHNGDIKGGLKIPSNTMVAGADMGATTIKIADDDYGVGGPLGYFSKMPGLTNDNYAGDTNIVIRDLTIDGSFSDAIPGVAHEMEGIDFVNVDIFSIINVEIRGAVHEGLDFDECDDGIVDRCYVWGCQGNGCHWSRLSNRGRLLNSTFVQNGWNRYAGDPMAGANVDHSSLSGLTQGNLIIDGPRGYRMDDACYEHRVIGNEIRWTGSDPAGHSGEALVTMFGGKNVFANNIVSSAGGDDTDGLLVRAGSGSCKINGNEFSVKRRGIEVENPGGANIIGNTFPGTNYNRAIFISGGANGRGSNVANNVIENRSTSGGQGTIRIEGGAKGAIIANNQLNGDQNDTPAVLVEADNCQIIGNNIEGGGVFDGVGIDVEGDDCIVEGNQLGVHTTAGIRINASSNRTNVYGNNVNGCAIGIVDAGSASQISPATGPAANIGA